MAQQGDMQEGDGEEVPKGTAQCLNWDSVTPAPIAAVDEMPPVTVLSRLSA